MDDKKEEATEESIAAAEALSGLEFTDAQREEIRNRVEMGRKHFESLREVDVGYDVEPPTVFLPSVAEKGAQRPFAFSSAGSVERPGSDEDLAFLPVTALARLVESRSISPVELTNLYLERLSSLGPQLHCLVTLTEDLALEQAKIAEAEIGRGDYRGPLHGIPWGAKDLLATKGIPTTWGATPFKDQVINRDATVVTRLQEAGAVLIGKLSLGALAQGPYWFGGMTRTPWDVEKDSSGSSAGPGAATAAGLVGFSIGSETLGSIVSPSYRCGLVGLRPTYGRVSRYGAMALSWTMDKLGPMCRGVEDCAAVLAAIFGPDGKDRSVADVPFNWAPDLKLEDLKIGYLIEEFDAVEESEAQAVDREALAVFESLGLKPEPVILPEYPADALRTILHAEAAAAFDDLTRSGEVDMLSEQDQSNWPHTFRAARMIPAVEYLRAQRVRALLMREMEELMAGWDVLLAPGTGGMSLPVTNLTGNPAVLLPCGFVDGLPRGLTLIGRLYDEATVLAIARMYEQAMGWGLQRPDLSPLSPLSGAEREGPRTGRGG